MMFFKKTAFVISFLIFVSGGITSQEAKLNSDDDVLVININQAVELAVKGNLSLKESAVSLDAAARENSYSWSSLSPSLSAGASWSKNDKETNGTITLSGTASLSLSPSLYTNIKTASSEYKKAVISYEQAVRTVELNVRTAFWSLLTELENINLRKTNLASSKNQYESNLAKYNRGALSRLDVLTAQVSYQEAELNYESAKSTFENSMAKFRQMLALSQDTKIKLDGSFSEILSLKDISRESLTVSSPAVALLERQIETARIAVNASRISAYSPSLSASYSYRMSAKDNDTGSLSDSGSGTLTVGASVPLDGLLPWSSGARQIDSRKDTLKTLELRLEDARTTLEVNISSYLNQIKQAKDLLELRKSSIELAEQNYSMTLDAYNHGTKDLLSLQSARDSLFLSRVNLMNQAFSLETAVLNLENIIGVPFGSLGK